MNRASDNILLIGCYPPPYGGQSVHIKELHHFLGKKGFNVKVLNVGQGRRIPSGDYVSVRNKVDLIMKLIRLVASHKIVHVHDTGHSVRSWGIIFITSLTSLILRRDYFVTLHSGMCPDYLLSCGSALRSLARKACNKSACVVAVNNEIRNILVKLGVSRDKTTIIEAFSLTEDLEGIRIPADLEAYLKSFSPLMTCVGFPSAEYGLQSLEELITKLKGKYPKAGILVIGARSPIEGKNSPQMDAIKWLGPLDRLTSLYLIGHSAVFLRPSLNDGDAISVREALAMGVPVVASNVGFRPPGVVAFEKGNIEGFILAVEKVLQSPGKKNNTCDWKSDDNLRAILECYRKYSRDDGSNKRKHVSCF